MSIVGMSGVDLSNFDLVVKAGEEVERADVTGLVAVLNGGKLRADTVTGRLFVYEGGQATIGEVTTDDNPGMIGSMMRGGVDLLGRATIGKVHSGGHVWVSGVADATIGEVSGAESRVVLSEGGHATIGEVFGEAIVTVETSTKAVIGEIRGQGKAIVKGRATITKVFDEGCVEVGGHVGVGTVIDYGRVDVELGGEAGIGKVSRKGRLRVCRGAQATVGDLFDKGIVTTWSAEVTILKAHEGGVVDGGDENVVTIVEDLR
ncbi:hypothetical protein GCM10023195_20650 [Actinoallomurus liliacearum]|uniref:Uncharacterized protein n=1 Tax=Actinoallomurus liliacearum TaxID=1080073 RepID=A0ABP8TI82_9ACTN